MKQHLYVLMQEEVMAEESTDGEVETQVYTQDSQDSIGEVSKNTESKVNKWLLEWNKLWQIEILFGLLFSIYFFYI